MKYVALTSVDNDIILRGDGCLTSLSELFNALVEHETTEIEIRKDFADKFFTYSSLCDFVENAASIAPNVRVWTDSLIYDNIAEAVQDFRMYKSPAEIIYALEANPTRFISTMKVLCDSYMQAHDDANQASNKIATMLTQIEEVQKQIAIDKKRYDDINNVRLDTESKLKAIVSRVNFSYEKALDVDTQFVLKENSYTHILYVKDLTRVHYIDTLLYYVRQILNTLYGMPVRMLVIEPYYSYGVEYRYPEFKPHWDLSYRDVYSGDIIEAGFQPKLTKDILQNPSHVNYLIVLDRGGYKSPHIEGSNVDYVYTVSDLKDVPENIDMSKVISYSPTTLNIPFIPDFDKLSPEEKVTKYSTMPVTKHLINLLEEVK